MNETRPKIIFILFLTYVFIFFFAIYGLPSSITNNISSSGNSIFSSFFIIISIFIILIFFILLFSFKNIFQQQNNLYYLIIIFIVFFITFLILFTIYLNSTEYFEDYTSSPQTVNYTQSDIINQPTLPQNLNDINFFPKSTCITNKNKFGYLINNVCVEQNGNNLDKVDKQIEVKQKVNIIPKKEEISGEDKNFVGICVLPDKKFGYKIPVLGNDCYTQKQYEKYIQSISKNNVLTKKQKLKQLDVVKENLSKCELDKNTDFNKYCKNNYGEYFGMKEIIKCNNQKYQVQCAENFFNGNILPNNLSKCYDKNRDFNYICTNKLINKDNKNILTGGYKKLYKDVCKEDSKYRVECDENYYDGVPIYLNATPCYFQNSDFNQYCKNIFGKDFKLDKKISGNCRAGYLKGLCKKIN